MRWFYSALRLVFVGIFVFATGLAGCRTYREALELVPLLDSTTAKTVVLWRVPKVVNYGALQSSLPPERAVEVVDTREFGDAWVTGGCNLAYPKSFACRFAAGVAAATAVFWIPVVVVVGVPVVLVQKLGGSDEPSPDQRYAQWLAQTLRGADNAAIDSQYFRAFSETLGWPVRDPGDQAVQEDIGISITRVALFESVDNRLTVLLCGRAALVGLPRRSGEIREIEVCQAHETRERPLLGDTASAIRMLLPAAEALGRAQGKAMTVPVPPGRALKVEGVAEIITNPEAAPGERVNCVSRGTRRWTHPSQCD